MCNGQPHESTEAAGGNLPIAGGIHRIDHHLNILVGAGDLASRAATQKIEPGVMSDSKQPTLRICDRCGLSKRLDRFHERFLQHVFAIDDGPCQACAVAMQFGPQFDQESIE